MSARLWAADARLARDKRGRAMSKKRAELVISAAILADLERMLVVDIGGSGELTLGNVKVWADDVVECRRNLNNQRAAIRAFDAANAAGRGKV
jgi:hypothetical protein